MAGQIWQLRKDDLAIPLGNFGRSKMFTRLLSQEVLASAVHCGCFQLYNL